MKNLFWNIGSEMTLDIDPVSYPHINPPTAAIILYTYTDLRKGIIVSFNSNGVASVTRFIEFGIYNSMN